MSADTRGPSFRVFIGIAICAGILFFCSGLKLAQTLIECIRHAGTPCWQCVMRAVVLLLFLPVTSASFKYAKLSSYALFCLAAVAAVLAATEVNSAVNPSADTIITITLLTTAALLHWRSTWRQQ